MHINTNQRKVALPKPWNKTQYITLVLVQTTGI